MRLLALGVADDPTARSTALARRYTARGLALLATRTDRLFARALRITRIRAIVLGCLCSLFTLIVATAGHPATQMVLGLSVASTGVSTLFQLAFYRSCVVERRQVAETLKIALLLSRGKNALPAQTPK